MFSLRTTYGIHQKKFQDIEPESILMEENSTLHTPCVAVFDIFASRVTL